MQRLIIAMLAALTVAGVGSLPAPAAAAGAGEGQYSRYDRHDRYNRGYYPRRGQYYRRDNRGSSWERHIRRCERAYRSYNRRTDSYYTRYGGWRRCRL